MYNTVWYRRIAVGLGVLGFLALLTLPWQVSAQASKSAKAPVPYLWGVLYNPGAHLAWTTLGVANSGVRSSGIVYNGYATLSGDGASAMPFRLTGYFNGHGYVVFMAGGLGDPVRVDDNQPTYQSLEVWLPWMDSLPRNLNVEAVLQPDNGSTLSIGDPAIEYGLVPSVP